MPQNMEALPVSAAITEELEKTPVSKEGSPTTPAYDLSKFQVSRILSSNIGRKTITLLGTFPDVHGSDVAIVLLEKQPFRENLVLSKAEDGIGKDAGYFEQLKVHVEFINNIYGNFQLSGDELNAIKASVVYPATEKHIEKYTIRRKQLISETPEMYRSLTLPFINASQFSLDWVYNILEHKQEKERIVYENSDADSGFVLVPDMKWDGSNADALYLLAISHKRNIKSLRDLTAEHLPLLRNIRAEAAAAIEKRYGLSVGQLRMYLHYQPSFYHLHVHINPIRNDPPGIWCEKSHMLDIVISNLEMLTDYYSRATLPFVAIEGSKLLDVYKQEPVRCKPLKRDAIDDGLEDSAKRNKTDDEEAENDKP